MTGIKFPELEQLERIIGQFGDRAQTEVIERIQYKDHEFPIHCITLGSTQPDAPVLAFFGGVHGLEKIGSEVILSYMQTISQLLDWDEEFQARLEKSRLVFVPIVNPVGVYLGTRSNGNGVDLMRNSPVEGIGSTRIYSGHRITPRLPWYRGNESEMEKEAKLCAALWINICSARRCPLPWIYTQDLAFRIVYGFLTPHVKPPLPLLLKP